MEAMSAGLICVHPNYGALPETAANWTNMYPYNEDKNQHAGVFYNVLEASIKAAMDKTNIGVCMAQKKYADSFYSWDMRIVQWKALLGSLMDAPRAIEKPVKKFSYRT